MGPAFFAPRRLYAAATCLLLLAVFTLNVVRVENRSITHDEAFTYRYFVATPWYYLFDHFDANNHLVNSLG